eukprot:CAMPEP_0185023262 /NCGR_PEP_ID=MMETSP1103-20130426/5944_1 /TAXON_ID=36769 /ORGANISM="Paraphysomonas bandaiensis, Strain Caron Lab Isolate" /LENGTH=995 /DNA_ID=CAMNT_0027555767 /DNA_START=509 /DNA_END=3496 /DNA_ORIENTATION=+
MDELETERKRLRSKRAQAVPGLMRCKSLCAEQKAVSVARLKLCENHINLLTSSCTVAETQIRDAQIKCKKIEHDLREAERRVSSGRMEERVARIEAEKAAGKYNELMKSIVSLEGLERAAMKRSEEARRKIEEAEKREKYRATAAEKYARRVAERNRKIDDLHRRIAIESARLESSLSVACCDDMQNQKAVAMAVKTLCSCRADLADIEAEAKTARSSMVRKEKSMEQLNEKISIAIREVKSREHDVFEQTKTLDAARLEIEQLHEELRVAVREEHEVQSRLGDIQERKQWGRGEAAAYKEYLHLRNLIEDLRLVEEGVLGMLLDCIRPEKDAVIPLLSVLGSKALKCVVVATRDPAALAVARLCRKKGIFGVRIDIAAETEKHTIMSVPECSLTPLVNRVRCSSEHISSIMQHILRGWWLYSGQDGNGNGGGRALDRAMARIKGKCGGIVTLSGRRLFHDGEIQSGGGRPCRPGSALYQALSGTELYPGGPNRKGDTSEKEESLAELLARKHERTEHLRLRLNENEEKVRTLAKDLTAAETLLRTTRREVDRLNQQAEIQSKDINERDQHSLASLEERIEDNRIKEFKAREMVRELLGKVDQDVVEAHERVMGLELQLMDICSSATVAEWEAVEAQPRSSGNVMRTSWVRDKCEADEEAAKHRLARDELAAEVSVLNDGKRCLSDCRKRVSQDVLLLKRLHNSARLTRNQEQEAKLELSRLKEERSRLAATQTELEARLKMEDSLVEDICELLCRCSDKINEKCEIGEPLDYGKEGTLSEDALLALDSDVSARLVASDITGTKMAAEKTIEDEEATVCALEDIRKVVNETHRLIGATEDRRFVLLSAALREADRHISCTFLEMTQNQGDCFLSYATDPVSMFSEGVVIFARFGDSKEYREARQLSGGQQAACGLALLLALQLSFPSPLYIMDEVDSSLDTRTAKRVGQLMQKRGKEIGAQFLLISHRPEMQEAATRVIGLYRYNGYPTTLSIKV